MSTIPLAKPFNRTALEKMGGPYGVSIKYDGVPVNITIEIDQHGKVLSHGHVSRQGKPLPSLDTHVAILVMIINSYANSPMKWPAGTYQMVAEVIHPRFPDFKDVSGIVRSDHHDEARGLKFHVFDFVHSAGPLNYDTRMFAAGLLFTRPDFYKAFSLVETSWYDDLDSAIADAEHIASIETIEGAIIRSGADRFAAGKRSWGYQKVLVDPSVDLRVVSFEEAVSKDGVPLDMVGRINCEYKGTTIGVGPGKLPHSERRRIWEETQGCVITGKPLIAEVKYKHDPSYKALRQATFQRWRDDKDEPNEEI